MKTIFIDDDLYQYLLSQTKEIGESASSILRRLLKIDEQVQQDQTAVNKTFDFLKRPETYAFMNNTERYLFILSWAYQKDHKNFEKILTLGGRSRKYFATDEATLRGSGKSVHPYQIPGTPFWTITNSSTAKKIEMLSEALGILGYNKGEVNSMLGRMFQS